MSPVITIITPYRNAYKFIPDYVKSMLSQTFTDWTCILIDDNSSDAGPALLSSLVSSDPRFRLYHNSNHRTVAGPASARSFGLSLVKTDLTAFCDIDDIWHPQKLQLQLQFHIRGNFQLTVTAYSRFNDDLVAIDDRDYICPPSQLNFLQLLRRNPIPMLTVILSSNLAKQGFQEIKHEDFLFWLTLFGNHPALRYGYLPLNLAFYRVHGNNQSGNAAVLPLWTYQVFLKYGFSQKQACIFLLRWCVDHLTNILLRFMSSPSYTYTLIELLEKPPLRL